MTLNWSLHFILYYVASHGSLSGREFFFNFFEIFAKVPRINSISLIVRTSWQVREVASYALSKSQPPTTLGDPQNIEKTIWKKFYFFWSWKSVFHNSSWILEELRPNGRQNQLQRDILLQIDLFWGLHDQNSRKTVFSRPNGPSSSTDQ